MAEGTTRREAIQSLGLGLFLYAGTPVRIQTLDDGFVAVHTGKVEIGQGIRTMLAQAVAEELRVPLEKIRMVMGDTGLCPDDGGTWASLTTPQTFPAVRAAAAQKRGGALTPAPEWKVLGQPFKDVRGPDIVTGRQQYPSDLRVDGMLHGVIVRAPYYQARLLEVSDQRMKAAHPEARMVRDGESVAAVANDPVTAARAASLIEAKWEPLPFSVEPSNHESLARYFVANSTPPVQQPGRYPPLTVRGGLERALAEGMNKLESRYWLPYIAHTPMEPRSAIASWNDGTLEIRCGTQVPFGVRGEVARALALPEASVRVMSTGPGGGFGGKHRGEVEIEAARLSRATGKPVRVAWTREEEFTCAYHRPAGVVMIDSAQDNTGKLTAWRHRNYNSGAPALPTPYDTANISCEFHRSPTPVRQGPYRSLAAVANIFARESHMDDCAALAKMDPVEFRRRNLADERLKAVLSRLGKGPGAMACTIEKDARIALRAEIAVEGREIRLRRFTYVGDYGGVLNPNLLRNQIMGALIMGIGGALREEVAFDKSSQKTRALTTYLVPRFSDAPEVEIELIDRRDIEPAGAGEAAITLVAPAIANAVFQATGKRLRDLPLNLAAAKSQR